MIKQNITAMFHLILPSKGNKNSAKQKLTVLGLGFCLLIFSPLTPYEVLANNNSNVGSNSAKEKASHYQCSDQRLIAISQNHGFKCRPLNPQKMREQAFLELKRFRTKTIGQLIKRRYISGVSVNYRYLKALKTLYQKNNYKPFWVKNNQWTDLGHQLRKKLINADFEGLDPLDYPQTPQRVEQIGAALSDIRLSYGIMRFAEHLMAGRLRPSEILKEHDLKPKHPKIINVIKELLRGKNPNKVFAELAPPHPDYALLKQALFKSLKQPKDVRDEKYHHKLVANMERWRWMPRELGERYIWVNLPTYKTTLIENEREIYSTKAIIGELSTPTPLIASRIKNIIMNPSWVLPASVIKREILDVYENPTEFLSKKNIRLFKRRGREVDPKTVSWDKIKNPRTYVFKQDPGEGNSLGRVKILFPNQHSIYLHDTDEKYKFNHQMRALSHGCIRLADPIEFADKIASFDKHLINQTPRSKLGTREFWLKYKAKLPVYLSYFTIKKGADGALHEYGDVYQYDTVMWEKMRQSR